MNRFITLTIFTAVILYSCKTKADIEKEKNAIRGLLKQERKAHFEKNAELFISEFAVDMISVNKGKVKIAAAAENKERISKYFGSVDFIKWDDVAEPIIRFSDDGSMAYAVVQKQVILSYPDSSGKQFIDTTDYAWVSLYRKQKGDWKVEANISTNK